MEEWKYEQEKIKMEKLIDEDLQKSLSDESDNKSNNDVNDSSMKWIELGQLEGAQGKNFSPFLCTLFLHIFDT